ncbi:MAG: hypothetical protein JWQ16_1102 [Novosphingobium sp.]|nr:hypothetical protein [Novosphingobium sp.]
MTPDELAKIIAASLLRHQSRGLVDAAAGMGDVVIHGRADLTAVARDLLATPGQQGPPPRRSWAGWFVTEVELRKGHQREEGRRQALAEQLRNGATPVDLALGRLRLRALDGDGDI